MTELHTKIRSHLYQLSLSFSDTAQAVFDTICSCVERTCSCVDTTCSCVDTICSCVERTCSYVDTTCSCVDTICSCVERACSYDERKCIYKMLRFSTSKLLSSVFILCTIYCGSLFSYHHNKSRLLTDFLQISVPLRFSAFLCLLSFSHLRIQF